MVRDAFGYEERARKKIKGLDNGVLDHATEFEIGGKSIKNGVFAGMVSGGESENPKGTAFVTVNSTSHCYGEGPSLQYNWGPGTSGPRWNDNRGWKGGNRTGE